MRIAFVASEYVSESNFSGGLANYLYQITHALVNQNHHPEVFVSSDVDEIIIHDNIIVHRIKITNHDWTDQSLVLNKYLLRINNILPFDIIQYSSWMAVGYHRLLTVPSVVRISSFNPLLDTNKNDPNNETELKSIINSDAIYCPSNIIALEISKYTQKTIKIIETPVEINSISFDNSIYNKNLINKKYLLFFGRLTNLKGIDTICEIIYVLLRDNPNLHFVFSGDGTIDKVTEAAKEFANRIIYFTALRHPQLFPIIQNSIAVILPSKVDNFPNACIESMALKKIVVGTKNASFEQLIQDGNNGFLIKIGSSVDLLNKINKILNLTTIEKDLIQNNSAQSIKRLQPQKIVKKVILLFENTINKFRIN